LPEPDDENSDNPDDDYIRVLFTAEQLERKLRGIFDRNRTLEAETGIHTLQIAFGFVEWREPASLAQPYFAPLLLMPVELERRHSRGHYVYQLCGHDEDLSVNLALQELLRHFDVELPSIEDDDTPEAEAIRRVAREGAEPRRRRELL
jgi:hypothetical protein